MPLTFNVGILVGPLLGGWLQDPLHTFPGVFGPVSFLGGANGVLWLRTYPYALPNLFSALFLLISVLLIVLGLEETHTSRRHRIDIGIETRRSICRIWNYRIATRRHLTYTRVEQDDLDDVELSPVPENRQTKANNKKSNAKLPYARIFTRNVLATLLAHGMLAGHLSAFGSLWFLFLATPRFDPATPVPADHQEQQLPFTFTGGLGLSPPTIGLAIGIVGAIGLCMQFGLYTRVTHRFGIVSVYRGSLLIFPFCYALVPYLAVVPTTSATPSAADGPYIWLAISCLLLIVVTGRTFSLPCTQILINNCTPHPSVLSTVHGIGQSVSAGARTFGPLLWTKFYGIGLERGTVGIAYWLLAVDAFLAFMASFLLYEGTGHEIELENDERSVSRNCQG